MTEPGLLSRVDHLVYGCRDLELGIREIERLLGVRAAVGGRHPLWGTHNALLALGARSYLEIIAPDPDQAPPTARRPFGLDSLKRSHLITWAANGTDLPTRRDEALRVGVPLGEVLSGSRRRADGLVLQWRLTDLHCVIADGVIPFLIDWGTSVHPATAAPRGATLVELKAEHPEPERIRRMLEALALNLSVDAAPRPSLTATIRGPNGIVVIDSRKNGVNSSGHT